MKNILVLTDYSDVANNAVRYALAIIKNTEAKYVFFHAGNQSELKLRENINSLFPIEETLQNNSKYITSPLNYNLETIKELIRHYKIDFIFMGTIGDKKPIFSKIFGSNTAVTIEGVDIPVIAVPPEYTYKQIKKIAFASDINLSKEPPSTTVKEIKHIKLPIIIFPKEL